jgi:hypothetical protein
MAGPYNVAVEHNGSRAADHELRRLQTFWLNVIALAIADQDEKWIRGVVSGRDLILEAAGIEPGYWDRIMLPLADAIRTERKLAELERRPPRQILPGAIERRRLRHSSFGSR